jgi:Tfp pilus assembly protein PilF
VFRIVRKELAFLVLLFVVTVLLFLFTRSMAARNRTMNVEIANTWYQRGQEQLMAGKTQEAIDSFRNATTSDHDNAAYTLALATALAAADHIEEARQGLLRLRTAAPENGEVNLNLARLASREENMSEAVRYYHNALYGVWPPDQMASQRVKVRIELIRFLLEAGDTSRSLSELLILSSDTPDNGPAHNKVGQMFLEAGDSQHALEEFIRALRLNAKDAEALNGAGRASFNIGEYGSAIRYLDTPAAAGARSSETASLLETAQFVLSRDPLASGLATEARIRRLTGALDFVAQELQACIVKKQAESNSEAALQALQTEIDQDMQGPLRPGDLRRDAEGFRTGLNLIQRIESATGQICGESSTLHNALLLIGKRRGAGER